MNILTVFDKSNYSGLTKTIEKTASRGIIFINEKILLVHSDKYNDYKLPGGALDENETKIEALIREVYEETGRKIKKTSIKPYGKIIEKRKSIKSGEEDTIFYVESSYYTAEVFLTSYHPKPTESEILAGYKPVLVDLDYAISENDKISLPWIIRDNYLLKLLKNNRAK